MKGIKRGFKGSGNWKTDRVLIFKQYHNLSKNEITVFRNITSGGVMRETGRNQEDSYNISQVLGEQNNLISKGYSYNLT